MKEHIISGSIYDVKTVNIDYIKDPDNIRLDCNDVSDLAASIKEHGILHPLTVTNIGSSQRPCRYRQRL